MIRLVVPLLLALLAGCATPIPRQASKVLPVAGTVLDSQVRAAGAAHPGLSGLRLLETSTDAFTARAELIRKAQRSLDIQYYIVHDGLTTRLLVNELLKAADRGVRIRFLIDDTSSDGNDYQIAVLAAHPNVQIRVFNPLHLGRSTGPTRALGRLVDLNHQHRRMHNKLWLADDSVAIVGGRNLGDEYFDARPEMNFTDLDLLAAGPVARQLGTSFDQYWNSPLSQPARRLRWFAPSTSALVRLRARLHHYLDSERTRDLALYNRLRRYATAPQLDGWLQELTWAHAQAFWDAPRKVLADDEPDWQLLLTRQLQPILDGAQHELLLVSSYFVPMNQGVAYLGGLAARGVDVRVLTNALEATDVPAVHAGYAPYRTALLAQGVKLFELRARPDQKRSALPYSFGESESSLHSKAMAIDGRWSFIGSFNFDPRSVLWNTEVGVMVDSPALTGRLRQLMLQGMDPSVSYAVQRSEDQGRVHLQWVSERNGQPRVLHHEPGSAWRRFNAWVVKAVGLERML
ncbi:phospholipase D family protein [Pseudomonas benzopyrenica]|uniref:Phospholipase D family protein n=1 Tax=Pseudomonas benzopyrenica TaxID=2993566 RepID=A0ABZ2FRX0_9PSED